MTVLEVARRLVENRPTHRVVSLYFDLDPERFATAPARASQATSLIDTALRQVGAEDDSLEHEEKVALREDLERLRRYLQSREPPFQGARALAIFCSSRDDLFEVVQIPRPLPGQVVIADTPYIEPLVASAQHRRWCVALVSRADARILVGIPDRLAEHARIDDDVHGQHDQGGWSQARYERSVDQDADNHLRGVARELERLWREDGFDRLALGGPQEVVARFEGMLAEDLRARLIGGRVAVDLGSASEAQIREVAAELIEQVDAEHERKVLDRLAAGLGSGGRAAGGPGPTIEALNERRVETLLLQDGVDRPGGRCPKDGLLTLETEGLCPVDGSAIERVEHLREAALEAALEQDASLVVVRRYPDLGPHEGMAALLRF